jgi:hypothetical protein
MKNIMLTGALICIVSIVACQEKNGVEVMVASGHGLQAKASSHELPTLRATGRVKEVKPGASVLLVSANKVNLVANHSSSIVVTLKAQSDLGTIQVDMNTSDGLQLMGSEKNQNVSLSADGYYPIPITLFAQNNGRYYLNLKVTINNGGYLSSRVLVVIAQVGPVVNSSNLPLKVLMSEPNKNIISLPAKESINTH